ncbi:MAG: DUF3048 domain-containing protein [Patescibacteria group bacterium]|nr:DUF3048 domain-containing protein [Patescibacteria group bacterium]
MKLIDKIKQGGKKFEPVKWLSSFAAKRKGQNILATYKEVWIGLGLLMIVVLVIVFSLSSTVDKVSPAVQNVTDILGITDELPRHPLTGVAIDEEYKTLPQVFGIMVENSADAWPLSGIDDAFLVIEAPVEANIPRFIVFFSDEDATAKVGPVRSARSYYLDWNDEFDAVYAHVGGSPEALELIRDKFETIDFNQFWHGEYFYRSTARYAPHNVYTTIENLTSALEELDLKKPEYGTWLFKNDEPVENNGKSLSVNFADGTTYDLDWRYNQKTNDYTRYQGTSIMRLDYGDTVEVNNVAVIATDIKIIDNEGRKSIVTVGEGDALLAQDGKVIVCRWRKEERTERLRFFDIDGEEIKMNAGKTWIEVVSSLSQVTTHE